MTHDPFASLRGRGGDHTVAEIAQQPGLWRELGQGLQRWREEHPSLAALQGGPERRVVLTGAGTSAFAGEVLVPTLRRALPGRVDAVPTTSLVSDPRSALADDVPTLLVSFARSGDSPESVAATELADRLLGDVHHLVVTCNPEGHLATAFAGRDDATVLLMPAGSNDRGFAMTSSFTCMTLAVRLVLGDEDSPGALADRLATAAENAMAARLEQTAALAGRGLRRLVYLGSGGLRGLARESALKVMELTAGRLVALSDSSLGFRHGPKAFLDDDTAVLVYPSTDPYTRRYDLDIVAELRGNLGDDRVVVVGALPGDALADPRWDLPGLDDLDDAARAVVAVVGAQLLALQASLALGLPADNPFPSGEVNRVVQGVTIHPLTP